LEKNEYLEESGAELTDFEKSCVNKIITQKEKELENLKTLINR